MLGLAEHGDQRCHLVEEHVDVLLGGQSRHRGAGGVGGPGQSSCPVEGQRQLGHPRSHPGACRVRDGRQVRYGGLARESLRDISAVTRAFRTRASDWAQTPAQEGRAALPPEPAVSSGARGSGSGSHLPASARCCQRGPVLCRRHTRSWAEHLCSSAPGSVSPPLEAPSNLDHPPQLPQGPPPTFFSSWTT